MSSPPGSLCRVSSKQGIYQLKPVGGAKLWWSILGVSTLLLLLPVVINASVPAKTNNYEQLSLDAFGYEWAVPVTTEGGAPVLCEMTSDDLFMKYWDCNNDTTVVTMVVEGVEDPANTLRRRIRVGLGTDVSEDVPVVASEDGRAHVLVNPASETAGWVTLPMVALSQQGEGDNEDLTAIAIVNGNSVDYYASQIWSSMAQERGLPYEQELPIDVVEAPWQDEIGGSDGPGMIDPFELPFDAPELFDQSGRLGQPSESAQHSDLIRANPRENA